MEASIRPLAILISIWFLFHAAAAPAQGNPPEDEIYLQMLEKVKAGDTSVDYYELRMTFSRTSFFKPYGGDKKLRAKVIDAFSAGKYKKVLLLAEDVLETDYLDINTHYMCLISAKKLGDAAKAEFHKAIVYGLLDSIVQNGDGRSQETAYPVISTREEEFVLTALGFMMERREEIRTKGRVVDKIFARDMVTEQKKFLYFNKDVPNRWLSSKKSPPLEESAKEEPAPEMDGPQDTAGSLAGEDEDPGTSAPEQPSE